MKETITCYFATIGVLLGAAVSLNNNWIPLLALFVIMFALCVVWFAKIMQKRSAKRWRDKRALNEKLDAVEREFKAVYAAIESKQDKPEASAQKPESNVRPGSRPSIAYRDMVVDRGEKE